MQKLDQVFNVHGGEILNKKWSRELGCAIKKSNKTSFASIRVQMKKLDFKAK